MERKDCSNKNAEKLSNELLGLVHASSAELQEFLSRFGDHIVFVPVTKTESLKDERGTNRIQIVNLTRNNRREVSIFTTEEFLLKWVADNPYQCLAFAAGDLALTLPKDAWVNLDPGTSHALELSPADLRVLSGMENPKSSPVEPEEQLSNSVEAPGSSEGSGEVKSENDEIETAICEVLMNFPGIKEAYFLQAGNTDATPILGLLASQVSSEERFLIIEEIANLSRRFFQEAGAIEVFDDLNSEHSRSWDLFRAERPVFIRSEEFQKRKRARDAKTEEVKVLRSEKNDVDPTNRVERSGTGNLRRNFHLLSQTDKEHTN